MRGIIVWLHRVVQLVCVLSQISHIICGDLAGTKVLQKAIENVAKYEVVYMTWNKQIVGAAETAWGFPQQLHDACD